MMRHLSSMGRSVLREQLISMINRKLFIAEKDIGTPRHKSEKRGMRRGSIAGQMTATSITQTKYNKAVSDCGLKEDELTMRVDLEDVMNLQPTTVHQDTPFQRTYRVFQTLGLRHLYVHDDSFNLVGVITRVDLCKH